MSSADGGRGEDGYCRNSVLGGEMSSPLAHFPCTQPQGPPVGNAMPPPPIMWQPPLINQQFIHHQSHAQAPHPQQRQQQQQYNELYYNMHAQSYTASPVQPETYSVLPVGHGNFLKVYHRTEATPASGGANDTILYQQQFQQQQPYHIPAGQQTQPIYNSYELFSSNTLMTSPEINNLSQNIVSPELPLQSPQQQPTMQWLTNNNELHSSPRNGSTTTNMIINQLVNNWSPNLTGGTYSPFSGAPLAQVPSSVAATISNSTLGNIQLESQLPVQIQPELSTPINLSSRPHGQCSEATALPFSVAPVTTQNFAVQSSTQEQSSQLHLPVSVPTILESQKQQQQPQQSPNSSSLSATETSVLKDSPVVAPSASTATISGSSLQGPDGNKKRIVAEVKPMRMTYSDVLSKLNQHPKNQTVQPIQTVKSNSERKTKPVTFNAATSPLNERKLEHKRSAELSTGISLTQRQFSVDDNSISQTKGGSKKSSPRDNRESRDSQSNLSNSKLQNNKQRINSFNGSNISASNKHSQKTTSKITSGEANISVSNAVHKKRQNKRADIDSSTNTSGRSSKSGASHVTEKDFNGFYNVAAKTAENGTNLAHNSSSFSSSAHINNCRRPGKSNSGISFSTTASSVQNSRNMQRSSNGQSSSSYGYSTKRGRGNNLVAANNIHNRNLELAKKCLNTWFEYTMKVLTWLFYLVYDIVVLGFSMVYERLLFYYANGLAYAQQLRKDLRQNSNKPSFWLKNYLRRFDARFKKNSRWAFWRRFHKKKQAETSADFYKNGRLPQTGEEAMFSLLNCKGKDAYSILGVPVNCSQEQIRKHYKKIAVLVHPDKNKQAGAEEAFKVLQRAFELIGEPENRESYDRTLDEALHAEKAWTELHDLLSQLQTKITEAANTIRCSTCGLRHPRKLTNRPHYAARECASCKIRHSAREGDIWAETTLLGLRWKYLALMEGKVYNITDWANCQKGALSHLEPNSHMVQYRIVRGAQHQQQTQQQHHHHQQQPQSGIHQPIHNAHSQGPGKYKRDIPPREASLHEFLDNLYSGQHPGGHQNPTPFSGSTRKRTRRN